MASSSAPNVGESSRRLRPAHDSNAASKTPFFTLSTEESSDGAFPDDGPDLAAATKSTAQDVRDMRRMGKTQQLVRQFRLLSATAFINIADGAWEFSIFTVTASLRDGGRPALLYGLIWNFVGFAPIYLSMAEMAAMAPIAGSQYHWVSEFAPESCQRVLSYLTGWMSTIAWQSGNATGLVLSGTLIQTIILINNEDYGFPAWQGTLLALGSMCIAYVGNVYGAKVLHRWQTAVFFLQAIAYLAFLVPIWFGGPKATHRQVWYEFDNTGGWSSIGLAIMVGQLTGISTTIGMDGVAHMSEEVQDASSFVPIAMLSSYVLSLVLILPLFVTICYHVPDIQAALNDPTTYPAIYVMRPALSTAWITVVLVLINVLLVASNVSYLAAVTRDLFAFTRDRGMPFSRWLSTVHPRRHIPLNACNFSCVFSILLAAIYIGSPVAFYALTSLSIVAILQCYCFSIGCVLWRRIYHPDTLPPTPFALGRWGVPLNALAVVYSVWCMFWSCWPMYLPVTAGDFNWAPPIFVLVAIISGIYFVFKAKNEYKGPVAEVEGRREEIALSLQ